MFTFFQVCLGGKPWWRSCRSIAGRLKMAQQKTLDTNSRRQLGNLELATGNWQQATSELAKEVWNAKYRVLNACQAYMPPTMPRWPSWEVGPKDLARPALKTKTVVPTWARQSHGLDFGQSPLSGVGIWDMCRDLVGYGQQQPNGSKV